MNRATSDTEVDLLELIDGEVLNTVNASRVLNIPERTVRHMCKAGQLKGAKQYAGYGGKWLIPKSAIRTLRDWPEEP